MGENLLAQLSSMKGINAELKENWGEQSAELGEAKPCWVSSSVQFSCSVVTLCEPVDCSTPGLPVHHQLPEFTQTHVHQVSDAIQPSHPLPSPSPPTFNLSSIKVFSNESVPCIRWPKYWSFNFSIRKSDWFPLGWTGWISLQSKGLSRVFSNTTVQKHPFFSTQLSL